MHLLAPSISVVVFSTGRLFTPQPESGSRGIVVACRAGGRCLTPLPLSRAQFLSDRGQTWWGRIIGQDLGQVRSWETWLGELISDFDLPSPLPLSRARFLSDRSQTLGGGSWGRILDVHGRRGSLIKRLTS